MSLPASLVWEVRTTGNAQNGGAFDPSVASPGTDRSQSDAAFISYADLTIGATATQLTSAATPFTAAEVGNTIYVSGGAGFTVGRYNVRSVASGVATMDRAVGTAGSANGAGNLGGAMNHPALACGQMVQGNVLYIKAGTYLCGSSENVAGGYISPTTNCRIEGYATTRGDRTTRPVLQASASGMWLVLAHGTGIRFVNLELKRDTAGPYVTVGGFGAYGSTCWSCDDCKVTGTDRTAISCWGTAIALRRCWIDSCTGVGIALCDGSGNISTADLCVATNSTLAFVTNGGPAFVSRSVASGGANGFRLLYPNSVLVGCVARGTSGVGFQASPGVVGSRIEACIAANCGIGFSLAGPGTRFLDCAGYGNTSANDLSGADYQSNYQALTVDPFANAAGLDFSPNNAPGGGALLRAIPRTLPGLAGTSYPDIGAYQSQPAAGGVFPPINGGPVIR